MDDANNCAPTAVAIVTGMSFSYVNEMMLAKGRKLRGATPQKITNDVIRDLGYDLVRIDLKSIIRAYPKPHCNVLKNVTTHHARRFPGCFDPTKKYLAHTPRHILAIVDGQVQCWSVNNSLRIYAIYEVCKKQA